jgi:hypothetical protein
VKLALTIFEEANYASFLMRKKEHLIDICKIRSLCFDTISKFLLDTEKTFTQNAKWMPSGCPVDAQWMPKIDPKNY